MPDGEPLLLVLGFVLSGVCCAIGSDLWALAKRRIAAHRRHLRPRRRPRPH